MPEIRLLEPRAPYSWLPSGVTRLTPRQSAIFLSPARFRVVVAGRRSGKSYLSIAELIRAARSGHNKLCWYIAPSYRMAKTVLWSALKSAIPPQWIASKNETDLSITLKGYGSVISLRSADNPDSLRGSGLDLAILDEYSSIHPDTWHQVVRPSLADKRGHALILGSPRGYNALYDLHSQAQEIEDWTSFHFSTEDGGLVTPAELEAVKATLDPRTFGQEFEADFTTSVNRVYLMFQREHNVRGDVQDQGGPLLVGIDFNVVPYMSAVIGQKATDELHIIDELVLPNSNTQELAQALKEKYPDRRITVYPDPTGRARKTSAPVGQTDFSILQQAGFRLVAPNAPYAVVDRTNTVNSLLLNTQGRRRLLIHPRCKRLIAGLDRLPYKENTSLPDKSLSIEHHTDALGYLVMAEFPIKSSNSRSLPVTGL